MIYLKNVQWAVSILIFYVSTSSSFVLRNDFLSDVSQDIDHNSTAAENNIEPLLDSSESQEVCVTPNLDPGYCVEIKNCPVLYNHIGNSSIHEFIRQSRCGSVTEEPWNTKVCCGRYGHFRIQVETGEILTACITPNEDRGLCVEIQNCPVLLQSLSNTDAHEFLRRSRCGNIRRQSPKRPRVCCGQHGNYISRLEGNPLPKSCGKQIIPVHSRIFGGEEASIGEFPWMALIIHKNAFSYKTTGCAAFLIHVKYLITGAHCILSDQMQSRGPPFEVVLGEHNTETEEDCNPSGTKCTDPVKRIRIQEVITHPAYRKDSRNQFNDIALIRLKKGAEFSDYIQPICLSTEKHSDVQEYWLSGWGKTEDAYSSQIKLKVAVPAFPHDRCQRLFRSIRLSISPSQLCAGGEFGKDSCNGDSGGPLMYPLNSSTTWYAAGVVSYGHGCGRDGWPGVYTRISSYTQWIMAEILKRAKGGDVGGTMGRVCEWGEGSCDL